MKKIINLLLMSLMMVLMAGIAYGAISCTFDQTATTAGTSSTYIRGTAKNLSVTMAGWTDNANSSVAIISAGATGCTISGALTFNTTTNTNQSYMNTTVNTLAMKDDTTCTFTMTIKNASNQVSLTTCTRDYISDNTIPVFGSPTPSDSSTDNDGRVDFSIPCTNTSSANLVINDRPPITMTESSDVCTYTADALVDNENKWYATASDGLNSTTSSTYTVNVQRQGGFFAVQQAQAQAQAQREAQQKGLRGFLDWLFSIPIKIINGIKNSFK